MEYSYMTQNKGTTYHAAVPFFHKQAQVAIPVPANGIVILYHRGGATWRIGGEVDVAPIIGWSEALSVVYHALHTGFAQTESYCLLHRQPGHVIDQLLLCLLVHLQARVAKRRNVGLRQFLLNLLLLGSIGGVILTVVHA